MGMRSVIPETNSSNTGKFSSHQKPTTNQRGCRASRIEGWRKQCLYVIITLLMILISVNLSLTLWILKVMELSATGIGGLKITSKGVQLEGQAVILDGLRTSKLTSRQEQPIIFVSSRNITFNTRDTDGLLDNQLFLGHDKLEVQAKSFRVADIEGRSMFHVDRDSVDIASGSLRIKGEGGIRFSGAIQTKAVHGEPGKDLKLESRTRRLELSAAQEVFIHTEAGKIEANSLNDMKLTSEAGSIRFSADKIIFSNVKSTQLPKYHDKHRIDQGESIYKIYQLCVCDTGRIFLAPSDSVCAVSDISICS